MNCLKILLFLSIFFVVGCGAKTFESVPVTPPAAPPAAAKMKILLEDVAKTGEVGSGTEELKQLIEEIKKTDTAKGDALLAELDKLQAASGNPAAAKAKATEMLGKL